MNSTKKFFQAIFLIGSLLGIAACYEIFQQSKILGIDVLNSKWIYLLAFYFLSSILCLIAALNAGRIANAAWLSRLDVEKSNGVVWQVAGGLTLAAGMLGLYFLRTSAFGTFIPQSMPTVWMMWWIALIATAFFRAGGQCSWEGGFALSILIQGAVFALTQYAPPVSAYPFSLGWSEASRYYYASLVFGGRLYGQELPLSFLHPTRYFMQSLPFLVDGLPVWAHRLWQVILWLGCSALTGFLLARRLKPASRLAAWVAGMGFALLMLYVGVYYHLQVMIWIVLVGVLPKHLWRSLVAVLLASFWAGMSRVNWFPVPAMLALTLYFLEEPVRNYRNMWFYLGKPALWSVAGLATALASQSFYVFWSGNGDNVAAFGSSFTSDLLWNRLWPNATFPPGIVNALAFIAVPLVLVIAQNLWGQVKLWHPIRLLGLGAMLFVLLSGGLVVSVKIGGGGDLHNMDAFMTLLGVIALYLQFERAELESPAAPRSRSLVFPFLALAALLSGFVPVNIFPARLDNAAAWTSIQSIQQIADNAVKNGGEVLFINQRHLLADKAITGVPLVPEYEVVSLMEMAMSGNTEYLNKFYADLHNHRFAAIIASQQNTSRQPDNYPFAAENNAWSEFIAKPLLCEYEISQELSGDVVIMTPRNVPVCP